MTVIRPASSDEASAIRALVESAYRGDAARAGWTHEADLFSTDRTSDAEISRVIANPAQCLLVAEQDGRLIGTVTISSVGPRLAYLGMFAVDPQVQASGLGRKLLAAAEVAAQCDLGAWTVEMTVIESRTELIGWYERRGYRSTGERRPFPYPPDQPVDFAMTVLERTLR